MVETVGGSTVGLQWYRRRLFGGLERLDDAGAGLVCDQHLGPQQRYEVVRASEVVGLSAGQVETCMAAERIDQGVYLGA